MSRGSPLGWIALVVALTLAPSYELTCGFLNLHYRSRAEHYQDAAMELNQRRIDAQDFTDESICEVRRYIDAAGDALSETGFNAYRLITDWNKDFLIQQPSCR